MKHIWVKLNHYTIRFPGLLPPFLHIASDQRTGVYRRPGNEATFNTVRARNCYSSARKIQLMYVCYTSVKGKPFCQLAVHSVCKRYTKVHLYWVPCMA